MGGERPVEGVGIRAVVRVFAVAPNTVLWQDSVCIAGVVGDGCQRMRQRRRRFYDQADVEDDDGSPDARECVRTVSRRVHGARRAIGPEAIKGKTPDGTIEMHEVQAAYIGSGSGGGGVLSFRGVQYPFDVGGVGVGGVGVSTIEATGEVYNLRDLRQFPGTYGQARYGFAIGTASAGDLWLQNEAGVILHLKAKRTGLMLSLGGGCHCHLDALVKAGRDGSSSSYTGVSGIAACCRTARNAG